MIARPFPREYGYNSRTRRDSPVHFPVGYNVSIGILALRVLRLMVQSAYFQFRNDSPEIVQHFRSLFAWQEVMVGRPSRIHHQLEGLDS